jgi:hypothetical protein
VNGELGYRSSETQALGNYASCRHLRTLMQLNYLGFLMFEASNHGIKSVRASHSAVQYQIASAQREPPLKTVNVILPFRKPSNSLNTLAEQFMIQIPHFPNSNLHTLQQPHLQILPTPDIHTCKGPKSGVEVEGLDRVPDVVDRVGGLVGGNQRGYERMRFENGYSN